MSVEMNEADNALSDRFKRAPSPAERSMTPAEARVEAERRLHQAWLSETARQPAKVEEFAPVALSEPVAPAAPEVDPRTAILGQLWESTSDDPKWVAPPVPDWTIGERAGAAVPQDQEWVRPREWNTAPAEPEAAPQHAAPAPQYAPQASQYVAPAPQSAPQASQYVAPAPQSAPPAPQYTPAAQQYAAPVPQYAPQAPQSAPQAPQYAPQAPQYAAPVPQYAPPAPQYAPQAPQYAPQAPQYAPAAPQYAAPAPQYAPQAPQYAQAPVPQYAPQPALPSTPVAPQLAPSFPPSDDATLRNEIIDNLEFARQRVEELRKLQEWRLGQERRVSEEIGRRNALAEAALEEELQARREAEEHRIEQWKAEARTQLERDLAREEAQFERRLADRRREAEVELEARLLRRLDDAARRAEALEKGGGGTPQPNELAEPTEPTDPRLYVVRSAG